MAILTGFTADQIIYADNTRISIDLSNYTTDYYPPHINDIGNAIYGTRVSNAPYSSENRSITGFLTTSYIDDFYNRIHVIPGEIDLGSVFSVQSRQIEVWNAFLSTSKTLNTITAENTSGITFSGVAAGHVFQPNESVINTVSISEVGPVSIAAQYTFNFDSQSPYCVITGNRAVVWPFMPQWGIDEAFEWRTDVISTYNGEQRFAVSEGSLRSYKFTSLLTNAEFTLAKSIALKNISHAFGIPRWLDLYYVGAIASGISTFSVDTNEREFAINEPLLIWESYDKWEVIEIESLTSNTIVGKSNTIFEYTAAYIVPLITSIGIDNIRFSQDESFINVEFSGTESSNQLNALAATDFQQYKSLDIYTDSLHANSSYNESIQIELSVFDNNINNISVDTLQGYSTSIRTIQFNIQTRADLFRFKKWLHFIAGRQRPFWLPSNINDLTLAVNYVANSNTLVCEYVQYELFNTIKNIVILLNNGTRLCATITSGEYNGGNNLLYLEGTGIDQNINVSDVAMISFLDLVRFDSDKITLKHIIGRNTQSSISVKTLPL